MNLDTIVKLLDAGYTKAEIDAMQTAPAQEQTAPAPEQTAPAAPAPEQTEPAQEQTASAAPAGYSEVLEALNKLTQTMILHNINTQGVGSEPQRTAEDALAEIIAPPGAQRNKLGGR